MLASLDGKLITGPEVLRDRRVYELSVRVQAGEWPEWADRLDGELLSHLTPAEITTPTFSWSRGDHVGDGETYEQAGSVILRFSVTAGMPAPPLLMRLTWSGEIDSEPHKQALDIAGHRELRLRLYDETRDRATDYPVFDERLLAEYDRLARAGFDNDQLRAFCRLFTAVCRAGLTMTWERKYRRGTRVTEREFHDDLYERLMADPELGGRLERGTALGLGYLDVRHDGITAELNVERNTPVTEVSAPKYMGHDPVRRRRRCPAVRHPSSGPHVEHHLPLDCVARVDVVGPAVHPKVGPAISPIHTASRVDQLLVLPEVALWLIADVAYRQGDNDEGSLGCHGHIRVAGGVADRLGVGDVNDLELEFSVAYR